MRLLRQGLLGATPLPMGKGTVMAWIGLTAALGTGMGLLLRTQRVVAAKRGNAAITRVEQQPSELRQRIVTGESKQKPEEERSQADGAGHLRRTALRSILSPALPLPPLPSRVLPGPLPKSDQGAPNQQRHLLPSPPVPSKIPPGPIPEDAQDNSGALDEANPSEPK
jgi:hypothetical protein